MIGAGSFFIFVTLMWAFMTLSMSRLAKGDIIWVITTDSRDSVESSRRRHQALDRQRDIADAWRQFWPWRRSVLSPVRSASSWPDHEPHRPLLHQARRCLLCGRGGIGALPVGESKARCGWPMSGYGMTVRPATRSERSC